MARIEITGNERIDGATAELAIALAHYRSEEIGQGDQEIYNWAMRLRDDIMEGTRELDHERVVAAVTNGVFPELADRSTATGRILPPIANSVTPWSADQ